MQPILIDLSQMQSQPIDGHVQLLFYEHWYKIQMIGQNWYLDIAL